MKVGDMIRLLPHANVGANDGDHKHGDILTIEYIRHGFAAYPIYTNEKDHVCWSLREVELLNQDEVESHLIGKALTHLREAKKLINIIEGNEGFVMGDSLSEIIEALEHQE